MANEWIEHVKEAVRHGGPQGMRNAYYSAGQASTGKRILLMGIIGTVTTVAMGVMYMREVVRIIPDPVTAERTDHEEEPPTS